MTAHKFAVAAATFALVTGSALAAPSVLGAWKGRISINMAKLPKATSPQMQQMIDTQIAAVAKAVVSLTMNKNGTFSISVAGMTPAGSPPPAKQTGTWTLKGMDLTLKSSKAAAPPQVFKLGKNGKSFSAELNHGSATMTFTR